MREGIMFKDDYPENTEELDMRQYHNGIKGVIDGLPQLARIVEAELNLQKCRRTLAGLISGRELASESALRYYVQEQEASDLFYEAINSMPFGYIYIGSLIRRLPATAEGYGLDLVSSEPFKVRFTFEPPKLD